MPDLRELEERMRPGGWSEGGFLGAEERLEEVLVADEKTLADLGITCQEIVEALALLIDAPATVGLPELPRLSSVLDWSDVMARWAGRRALIEERFGHVESRGWAAALVGGRYEIRLFMTMGYVACPWGTAFPDASCGRGEGDWSIRDTARGLELRGPTLITHLIEQHGFFEGLESPYRVDPRALAELLELGPFAFN